MQNLLTVTFSAVLINSCLGANILFYIPGPFISHHQPFKVLVKELSLRGHNVTSITAVPLNDPTLVNLTEIDVSYNREIMDKNNIVEWMAMDSIPSLESFRVIRDFISEIMVDYPLTLPEIKNILEGTHAKFDLLFVEAQVPQGLMFAWKNKCPVIGISSMDALMLFHISAANSIHPVVTPDMNLPIEDPEDMNFIDRVLSTLLTAFYPILMHVYYRRESAGLRKILGDDFPELYDLQKNISMLFITTNEIIHNPRLMNPNTITLGHGMHITPANPLPKDIKYFLDASKDVVYFSLGSTYDLSLTNEMTMRQLVDAFADLPYNFLLKSKLKFDTLPKNILQKNWFPQQDVLHHPNLKLFITQGGLQSIQEGLIHNVPMIGIPILADQTTNVNKMAKKGFGIKIHRNNITKESITDAVLEIMTNNRYRDKAKQWGEILRDTQVSDLDKAMWWTEYVIRHKGADHLKSLAVDMPFWKYWLLDVIGFISVILFVVLFLVYKAISFTCRKIFRRKAGSAKQHKD